MTNKFLLATIAVGLWANLLTSWVKPARADDEMSLINFRVGEISDFVEAIAKGKCANPKICN